MLINLAALIILSRPDFPDLLVRRTDGHVMSTYLVRQYVQDQLLQQTPFNADTGMDEKFTLGYETGNTVDFCISPSKNFFAIAQVVASREVPSSDGNKTHEEECLASSFDRKGNLVQSIRFKSNGDDFFAYGFNASDQLSVVRQTATGNKIFDKQKWVDLTDDKTSSKLKSLEAAGESVVNMVKGSSYARLFWLPYNDNWAFVGGSFGNLSGFLAENLGINGAGDYCVAYGDRIRAGWGNRKLDIPYPRDAGGGQLFLVKPYPLSYPLILAIQVHGHYVPDGTFSGPEAWGCTVGDVFQGMPAMMRSNVIVYNMETGGMTSLGEGIQALPFEEQNANPPITSEGKTQTVSMGQRQN